MVGFALLLTMPLIGLFYSQSNQIQAEVTASQADRIATEIVNAADEVYYMGEPAKRTLTIYMPDNVKAVTLRNNKLILNVSSPSGEYEVVKWADTNLSGSISPDRGRHKIKVEARFNDVNITE